VVVHVHDPITFLGNKQALLPYLYWRFGVECGTICKIFKSSNFSWGTYDDLLGSHCNSHTNNFVLLPFSPSDPTSPLLAPLDFDMAFTKPTFSLSDEKFYEYLTMEENGMKMVLGGEAISTGVTAAAQNLSLEHTLVRDALRDTMVLGFNEAFEGKDNKHNLTSINLITAAHALLKMALIVTDKETA